MDFPKKKSVVEVLSSKPARRKPSPKNLPHVFWEGWREGFFETYERDPGPLKGVGVSKVKSLISKLDDMASRPLSGFSVTPEFVQTFAQWSAQNWDSVSSHIKSEQGGKGLPDVPSLGWVVTRAPDFLAVYLSEMKGPSTGQLGWKKMPGW